MEWRTGAEIFGKTTSAGAGVGDPQISGTVSGARPAAGTAEYHKIIENHQVCNIHRRRHGFGNVALTTRCLASDPLRHIFADGQQQSDKDSYSADSDTVQIATLGGGCFWCLEAVYEELVGVAGVESGYSGGHVEAPTYEAVCGKATGHAEVVQVNFDATRISYRQILEVFFGVHDPTTPDRQGNDAGPQYRSAIFTHDDAQAETARALVAELTKERVFDDSIVTQITALERFWPAEDYHREYFQRNSAQPYCMMVVGPKVAKFRQRFAHLLNAPAGA